MAIESVAIADTVKFNPVRKFLLDNCHILVYFCLFAVGTSFGLSHIRIVDGFEGC